MLITLTPLIEQMKIDTECDMEKLIFYYFYHVLGIKGYICLKICRKYIKEVKRKSDFN
jgi:hypothetical protein